MASAGGDTFSAIPAGVPAIGGPVISHVYQQSPTVYIVTVTHDAGTDLIVPLQAANGFGWSLMDGGSVASPGTLIAATACVYVEPDQGQGDFRLGADARGGIAAAVLSVWRDEPRGERRRDRDRAWTARLDQRRHRQRLDMTPPAGWDIGDQLGSSWNANLPLAATTYGVAVSTSPT